MSEKPSKDEALEALDFIVNVLKEHEKDLDRLVNELATLATQFGETGELNGKVKKIEEKIGVLQNEMGGLVKSLSSPSIASSIKIVPSNVAAPAIPVQPARPLNGFPLVLKCKQWEDFQTLAVQAQEVSFGFTEEKRAFEVDALKNNKLVSFQGSLPDLSTLLKVYLSKQLIVSEKQIMEGTITLG